MAPKSPREAVKAAKDIHEAVEKELDFDPLVDASDITVKNLNGDVALNGTVSSYPQYLQAGAATKRVKGVTRVHNHLMVMLPAPDYRDDPMLTTAANNALSEAITVPPGLEASATDGDVWLTGPVCPPRRAEGIAAGSCHRAYSHGRRDAERSRAFADKGYGTEIPAYRPGEAWGNNPA